MTRRLIKIAANMLIIEVKERFQPATPGALSTDEVVASVSAGKQFIDLTTDTLTAVEIVAAIELESAEGEEVRWELTT
jgi:hypothetical protein